MILNEIIREKRSVVSSSKGKTPLRELKAQMGDLPSTIDFRAALSGKDCAVIAEIKHRSPSRGIIRDDFDHRQIARIYADHGAAAISVLTEEKFFGGSSSYLQDVRETVSLPLLRKDFIIDEYQIYEARLLGADALLLIASVLGRSQMSDYQEISRELGLHCLVEIHNEKELEATLDTRAEIIGINNRDLLTFHTDLQTTLRLSALLPPGKTVVSESGIHDRRDLEVLRKAGVHVFLIGETLMRAKDVGRKLTELLEM